MAQDEYELGIREYLIIGLLLVLSCYFFVYSDFLGFRSFAEDYNEWTTIINNNCSNFGGVVENVRGRLRCVVYYIDDEGFKERYYMNYNQREGWYKSRD